MERREFLTTMGGLAVLDAAPVLAAAGEVTVRSTSTVPSQGHRGHGHAILLGQVSRPANRLDQLAGSWTRWPNSARKKYGRGLDLAVLPETAITGEVGGRCVGVRRSLRRSGAGCVHPEGSRAPLLCRGSDLLAGVERKELCSNAAILVGRKGEVVGTYRKVHLVVSIDAERWRAARPPATSCRSSTATSASWRSRFATTWNSTTAGRNWRARAPNSSHGQPSRRKPPSPRSERWSIAATSSPALGGITPRFSSPPARLPRRLRRRIASWFTNSTSATLFFPGVQSYEREKRSEGSMATKWVSATTKTRIAASSGPMIPGHVRRDGSLDRLAGDEEEMARVRQFYRKAGLRASGLEYPRATSRHARVGILEAGCTCSALPEPSCWKSEHEKRA